MADDPNRPATARGPQTPSGCPHSRPGPKLLAYETESGTGFGPLQARQSIPAHPLQLDDLRLASGKLIEHSDPVHASPAAEVPAADDRPTAGGHTINRTTLQTCKI